MIDSYNDNNLNSNNPDNREELPDAPHDLFEAFEDYKNNPCGEKEDAVLEMLNFNLKLKELLVNYIEVQEEPNTWLLNQIKRLK